MGKTVASLNADDAGGILATTLLKAIDLLDGNFGAKTWNLAVVSVVTALALLVIRLALRKRLGIDWLGLIHAIVSGYGSLICVYLSVIASSELTGSTEPLRSITCQGALTSLHRFIPAVTMGYGLFDIVESFNHGVDFLAHGIATSTIMAYFCYYNVGEIIVPMLLMEISTIHLASVRAKFFPELLTTMNMGFFVLTFFTFRIAAVPYLWYNIMTTILEQKDTDAYQSCLPWHFHIMVFLFGMFFHCLNAFWFYKIILKVKRKLSGREKIKEGNDLQDAGQKLNGENGHQKKQE